MALACPACIEALGSGVYEGWLWGMGLMMVTPFFLLVVVGGGIVYTRRKALREEVERFLDEETALAAATAPTDQTGVAT
jgi:hypothetical protein